MADARPALDPAFDAFGQPARVFRPEGPEVQTTAFWITPMTEGLPSGAGFPMADQLRVLVVRRDEIDVLPHRTEIEMAELTGGTVKTWLVDSVEHIEADHFRVRVIPKTVRGD